MKKKRYKNIFTPPDWELMRESEAAEKELEERWFERQKAWVQYWCTEAKRLKEKYNKDKENKALREEYFKARDQLIKLARWVFFGGEQLFRDKETTSAAVRCLFELYDDSIKGICRRFCAKHEIPEDKFGDWYHTAYLVVYKLIAGDTPWVISSHIYEGSPTHETRIDLSEIDVSKRLKEEIKENKRLLEHFKKLGIPEDELKVVEWVFGHETKEFPKWVVGEGKPLSFEGWFRRALARQARIRKTRLALGLIEDKNTRDEYSKVIKEIQKVLLSDDLFKEAVELNKNKKWFKSTYEEYRKDAYKEQKFDPSEWTDFTTFLRTCLPRHLDDVYKRKELMPRGHVSLEQYGEGITEISTLPADLDLIDIEMFINKLTPIQRQIIELKREGYKDVEIAKKKGVSKGRISQIGKQIEKKAKSSGLQLP